MAALILAGEEQVDENFNFEKFLENSGFTEYNKIKDAINNNEITLNDILKLDESEIKETLKEYNVKAVQRSRFVEAIKKLPNSKINESAMTSSSVLATINSNNVSERVLLSDKEKEMINLFSDISDKLTNAIIKCENLKTQNIKLINNLKEKLTLLYNNEMKNLTAMGEKEEKECENNVLILKNHQIKCGELRKNYEIFILTQHENQNIEQKIAMDKSIKTFEENIRNIELSCNNLNSKVNDMQIKTPAIENEIEEYIALSWLKNCSDSVLSICGLNNKIINNGKTFHTSNDCLARTNYPIMIDDCGVYKIKWKINVLKYNNGWNAIGICTDYYQLNSNESQSLWLYTPYYIGWCGRQDKDISPNRLVCGLSQQSNNIFYESCEFMGDSLPQYNENDTVCLIYDSNNSQLLFQLNGKKLNSKLINIPKNRKLFWFVARWSNEVKFSIVN